MIYTKNTFFSRTLLPSRTVGYIFILIISTNTYAANEKYYEEWTKNIHNRMELLQKLCNVSTQSEQESASKNQILIEQDHYQRLDCKLEKQILINELATLREIFIPSPSKSESDSPANPKCPPKKNELEKTAKDLDLVIKHISKQECMPSDEVKNGIIKNLSLLSEKAKSLTESQKPDTDSTLGTPFRAKTNNSKILTIPKESKQASAIYKYSNLATNPVRIENECVKDLPKEASKEQCGEGSLSLPSQPLEFSSTTPIPPNSIVSISRGNTGITNGRAIKKSTYEQTDGYIVSWYEGSESFQRWIRATELFPGHGLERNSLKRTEADGSLYSYASSLRRGDLVDISTPDSRDTGTILGFKNGYAKVLIHNEKNHIPPIECWYSPQQLSDFKSRSISKLFKALQEIGQTEKSYNSHLQLLFDSKLIDNLLKSKVLSQSEAKLMFSDIKAIHSYGKKLIANLDKIQEQTARKPSDPIRARHQLTATLNEVRRNLEEAKPYYSNFINNYEKIMEVAHKASRSPKGSKLLLEFQKLPAAKRKLLVDFLIEPVQRAPRYELLVREALKNTPEFVLAGLTQESQNKVDRVAARTKEINDLLNSYKKAIENEADYERNKKRLKEINQSKTVFKTDEETTALASEGMKLINEIEKYESIQKAKKDRLEKSLKKIPNY